ncbi:hypothetical protein PsorP6_012549 [Peronosclerospora sorghi]|uniref:Uncharacterized protein n=1 Tax=Peronosclerospora sorghi TaxID=230839 RepID=A0ACC0WHG5_9STRA|nr:hypothetical protein PsorP6_012549 [Peronosclerospora sorghi]
MKDYEAYQTSYFAAPAVNHFLALKVTDWRWSFYWKTAAWRVVFKRAKRSSVMLSRRPSRLLAGDHNRSRRKHIDVCAISPGVGSADFCLRSLSVASH